MSDEMTMGSTPPTWPSIALKLWAIDEETARFKREQWERGKGFVWPPGHKPAPASRRMRRRPEPPCELMMNVYDWREGKRIRQRPLNRIFEEMSRSLARGRPIITLSPAYRFVPARDVVLAVLVAALHVRATR